MKLIDFMLLCVWSVTDRRGREDVVRTSLTNTMTLPCAYHILTSFVTSYRADKRQPVIYL